MILAAFFALALQASTPPLLRDPAFLAAHQAWAACTDRVADAAVGSARSAEEIAAAALAACPDEQAATRRAVIAFSGEARGTEQMAMLLDGNREGLVGRVRELRRRATAQAPSAPPAGVPAAPSEALISAWVGCVLRSVDAAAADAPERQVVEQALDGCGAEQEAMRRWGIARGGRSLADRFIREARQLYREQALIHLRQRRGQPAPAAH